MKKIIIDTDPGIDDAMAILFALNSPEIELVGLTAVFGNVYTHIGTQNALRLLEFAHASHIPVAHGAEKALYLPLKGVGDFVHGDDGLGNTNQPPPTGKAIAQPAAQFIVDTVMAQIGEITLVAVGPLTNLALALALEPRLPDYVAGVVIMGGAVSVNGNVNPAAEANIWADPHAADIVLTAGWPLTLVGLDVTMKIIMDELYLSRLRDASRTGAYIYKISRFYQQFHFQVHGINAIHTHDPAAIAYVINPDLFTVIKGPVRVLTEGIGLGHTLMDRRNERYQEHEWSKVPPINVCVDVDSARLLALFQERIAKAD